MNKSQMFADALSLIQPPCLVSGGRLNRIDKRLKARRDDERRSSSLSARWHRTATTLTWTELPGLSS